MKYLSLITRRISYTSLFLYAVTGVIPMSLQAQWRSLTGPQLESIVKPTMAQCAPVAGQLRGGQAKGARVDPAMVIPTRNARDFPKTRIAKTLHGMWRGQVHGDYKDLRVDYFWLIDTQRNEGLIIAQRTGNQTMSHLQPVAKAPTITYLMCASEGYLPSAEGGHQIHEFVKVSDSLQDAPAILQKAGVLKGSAARKARLNLSNLWRDIVASGYFKSLPAVAFAGGLFKPMQLQLVPSALGPSQVLWRWDGEYYGGGETLLKYTPGVPVKGVEYVQFVGTSAPSGDFLVASPGNGNLYKVEAISGANYDLAFDAVTLGPLQ